MKEDAKILTADLLGMSPPVRAWHVIYQLFILREMDLLLVEPTMYVTEETTLEAATQSEAPEIASEVVTN